MAAPGAAFTLPETATNTHTPRPPLQKQARSARSELKVHSLFAISEIATGLGSISAIAEDDKGNILVLDKKRGRLIRLIDRGRDGKIDSQIPFAAAFNNPTGLTRIGADIYIADLSGIWKLSPDGTVDFFLSLANANISGDLPRPLHYDPAANQLLFGLNRAPSKTQKPSALIKVDMLTKKASIVEDFNAPITQITHSLSGDIWISAGDSLRKLGQTKVYPLETGTVIGGFVLPQNPMPNSWPPITKDHIIVSQSTPTSSGGETGSAGTSGGVNIVSLPTTFGTPQNKIIVMADGFLSKRGHAAWGQPGALLYTQNGLYVADSWQGGLWLIKPAQAATLPAVRPVEKPDLPDRTAAKKEDEAASTERPQDPSSKFQSRISASQITGSQIPHGSTLKDSSPSLVKELQDKTQNPDSNDTQN